MVFIPKYPDKVRIDKYLWAIRVYKSRSMASDACNGGKVKIDKVSCKPSRELKIGETIFVKINSIERSYKVKALLDQRVAASFVSDFCTDLTPQEEIEKMKLIHAKFEFREPGSGRPTKKDYRDIENLKWYLDDEDDSEDEKS